MYCVQIKNWLLSIGFAGPGRDDVKRNRLADGRLPLILLVSLSRFAVALMKRATLSGQVEKLALKVGALPSIGKALQLT